MRDFNSLVEEAEEILKCENYEEAYRMLVQAICLDDNS